MLCLRLLNNGGMGTDFLREVDKQRQVVSQYLCAERYCILCGDRAVGPDLQRQLVVIGHVADTSIFNCVVYLIDRRIDRVYRDHADSGLILLVALCGDIAAAIGQSDLHGQARVAHERRNVQVRVEDLDLTIGMDVASGDSAFPACLNIDGLRAVTVELCNNALDIQHDFRNVFLYAGNGGELMLYAGDLDAAGRRARQGRQQDAAKGVAESGSVAAFQRFNDKLAVGPIFCKVFAVYTGLFNFDHLMIPSLSVGEIMKQTNEGNSYLEYSSTMRCSATS